MPGKMFMSFGLDGNSMRQRNVMGPFVSPQTQPQMQSQSQSQSQRQSQNPGCNGFGASMFQRINVKTTGGGGCGCGK